jgi:hypothetical protein
MRSFPTKRDFWYIFSIFIIINVFLLVHWSTNPSVLGAKLELASTLISIILSVIAIIYTLVDSSNNKTSSSKIIESANTIEKVTTEVNASTKTLDELIKNLTDLAIDTKLSNIYESMTSMSLAVDMVDTNIADIKKSISTYMPNSDNNTTTNAVLDKSLSKTGIYLAEKLLESYYHMNEIIYFVYKG